MKIKSSSLFDESNYENRVTIIDMPGTEDSMALNVDGYSKDDLKSDGPHSSDGASDEQNPDLQNDPNEQTDADDNIDSDHDRASRDSTAATNVPGSDGGDEEEDDNADDARAGNVHDAGDNDRRTTSGSDEGNGNDGGDAAGVEGYLKNHDWKAEFADPSNTALGIQGLVRHISSHQKKCSGIIYVCLECAEEFSAPRLDYDHWEKCTPNLPLPVQLKHRPR
ncbi:prostatic spermine-binding protein-like [Microplitis mediator]|uniref:prostatic spermine-binding protein-like n=1 Tax=Microplitis mediator TaxID=375433 RepID=UPI0025525881|nr:prostatic spermine-binding protein-like [Microplitis mediator]